MKDPVILATEAVIKKDWSEAAKHFIEACRREPDFDTAANYLMLAAGCIQNLKKHGPGLG